MTTEVTDTIGPEISAGRVAALPVLIGVAGLFLAIAVFAVLFLGEQAQRADASHTAARHTLSDIIDAVEAPMRSVERMSKRWKTTGYTLKEQWLDDARNYLVDIPALQNLVWSDQELIEHWIVDRSGKLDIVGFNSLETGAAGRQPTRDAVNVIAAAPHPLLYGSNGLIHELQLYDPRGAPAGYLRAVFSYAGLFEDIIAQTSAEYHLALTINGQLVLGAESITSADPHDAVSRALGEEWRLHLKPRQNLLFTGSMALPIVLSLLTFALGLFAASAAHFRTRANLRARQANEARSRMQAAIEALGTPFAFFDERDHLVHWNKSFSELHDPFVNLVAPGVTYGRLVRAAMNDGAIKEAAGREEAFYSGRMELHRGPGFLIERKLANGRWMQTNERRLQDGSTVTLITDISDQKLREEELKAQRDRLHAMQEQLREEQEKFQHFAEASADWFWATDQDHCYTWLSENVEKYVRFSREWHYGKSRIELDREGDNDAVWGAHLAQLERRESFRDVVFHRVAADGERWVRSSGVPQFDEKGVFTGYLGTGADITDLKLAERRFEAVRDQLSMAVNSITEGLMIFSPDDCLVLCNDNFKAHTPWLSEALETGRGYEDIIRQAGQTILPEHWDDAACQAWLDRRLNLRDSDDPVMEFETRDGEWCRITEQRTAHGGTVMVRTDITDLKLRQQELEIERNNAEKANRAKTDFLTNMSHELRTPLNAIIGFSDVMSTGIFGPLEQRYASYAEDIAMSGRHLLSLINDLLDGARIESGKYTLDLEDLSFDEQIRQAELLMQPLLDQNGLSLHHAGAIGDDLGLRADQRAFRQIMLNLLSNAVKFSLEGGRIDLSANVHGADLELRICDHGIGLQPEDLERVFERFVQVQDPMSRGHDGTGIGLPLSRSLAGLHGGTLHLESQPGDGVTAVLRLPGAIVARGAGVQPMRSIA